MTNTAKIIIGVLVLIILFLAFYLGKIGDENPSEVNNEDRSSEIEVRPTAVTGEGSLDELLARNENLECMITYKANATSSQMMEGTLYTSNGKMRGDFITTDNGQEILASMIIKDNIFLFMVNDQWSEIWHESQYGPTERFWDRKWPAKSG